MANTSIPSRRPSVEFIRRAQVRADSIAIWHINPVIFIVPEVTKRLEITSANLARSMDALQRVQSDAKGRHARVIAQWNYGEDEIVSQDMIPAAQPPIQAMQ